MPWTVADVDRHKKGLSDKQKRQWIAVANSALAACLKDKGEQKACEAGAIKQANSTIGTRQKVSVAGDNIAGNLMHGSGGTLNPMRDGKQCICTKCDHKSKSKDGTCDEKCPKCGGKMKAGKPKVPPKKSKFISYKGSDGDWRWISISNVAIEDKEQEIVSEKAYDDGIAFAHETGKHGELDLVHVIGTNVGSCDMMLRLGNRLIEGGKWFNTERAKGVREIVAADPDYWGVSIKFQFDPEPFDGRTYNGGIQILNRTILPRHMAASWGTAIAVSGGNMSKSIDEEAKVALGELGLEDEEIAKLDEAQKSLPSEGENIVEKNDDSEETVVDTQEEGFWNKMTKTINGFADRILGEQAGTPVSTEPEETVKSDTEEQQKAAAEVEPTEDKATTEAVVSEAMELFATKAATAFAEAIAPMEQVLKSIQAKQVEFEERLGEAEKFVEDKVIERLRELPPIVKARPTELAAMQTEVQVATAKVVKSYAAQIAADIEKVVKGNLESGQYKI